MGIPGDTLVDEVDDEDSPSQNNGREERKGEDCSGKNGKADKNKNSSAAAKVPSCSGIDLAVRCNTRCVRYVVCLLILSQMLALLAMFVIIMRIINCLLCVLLRSPAPA